MLQIGFLLLGWLQPGGLQRPGPRPQICLDLGAGNIVKVFFGRQSSELGVLLPQKVLRPGLFLFRCHVHPSFFSSCDLSGKQKSATHLSASTDKLGCTLLSKRERPDRCGRLSDFWQMPNTAMDGCSGFSPDHLAASISNIQLVCEKAKSCSNPTNRVAAAVFPQQKSHRPVLADPCVFPHLSSSSDLRILSSTQPSQD